MRKVVANSTPIIVLKKINRLDILKELYQEIMIPIAVYEEVIPTDLQGSNRDFILQSGFIKITRVKNIDAKILLSTSLHMLNTMALQLLEHWAFY